MSPGLCEEILQKDESLIREGGNVKLRQHLRQMILCCTFTRDDSSFSQETEYDFKTL